MANIQVFTGSEGPSHDPYSWTEIVFTKTDGTTVTFKSSGLGYCDLTVGGKTERCFDDSLEDKFEELTGLTSGKAEEIYYELHPYFDDPIRY